MVSSSARCPWARLSVVALPTLLACLAACSSLPCANPGGPAQNPNVDMHCADQPPQAIDPAACTATPSSDPNDPSVIDPNLIAAAAADPNAVSPTVFADANAADYGPTLFNTEGDDDDCKYHLTYSVDPICPNQPSHFVVALTNKLTGQPVTGAAPTVEVFLDPNHVAPNSNTTASESPAGTYRIGPVVFDSGGTWTVRFHFFENCDDSPASPHGHAAFFVNVPSP